MKKTVLVICMVVGMANVCSAQYTTIRINALGIATGTLNVGVDVEIADKWSIDVSVNWNPIKTRNVCTNIFSVTSGTRWWRVEPHVGLFINPHITYALYKVGHQNIRYAGWSMGIGTSIGYSWMLSTRWNFSLEGGAGFFYQRDTRYQPRPSPLQDIVLNHYRRFVLAPAKLEASFSFLF